MEAVPGSGLEAVNQGRIILILKKIVAENVLNREDQPSAFFSLFRVHARVLMMNGTMILPVKHAG